MKHVLWQVKQAGCGPYTDISGQSFHSATITPNNAGGLVTRYDVPVSDGVWINNDTPTQNYGNNAELSAYKTVLPVSTRRSLYRFDIENAGIPASAVVVSALEKIFVTNENETGPVTVHKTTENWSEASVNWDNINTSYDSSSLATIPTGSPMGQYV